MDSHSPGDQEEGRMSEALLERLERIEGQNLEILALLKKKNSTRKWLLVEEAAERLNRSAWTTAAPLLPPGGFNR
jgi:hypothetical protein